MKTLFFDIIFINVHASYEDKSQEEKDTFYDNLDFTLGTISQYRIRTVSGNLNIKIGKETIFKPTFGSHENRL